MKNINLSSNHLVDLSALHGHIHLERLALNNNQIVDLSTLGELDELRGLFLEGNEIKSLIPISGFSKLDSLYLPENQLHSLEGIEQLVGLKFLWLQKNKMTSYELTRLKSLEMLEELYLSQNSIDDLKWLGEDKTHLSILHLSGNFISDVGALAHMVQMKDLWLDDNCIGDFSTLKKLVNTMIVGEGKQNFDKCR